MRLNPWIPILALLTFAVTAWSVCVGNYPIPLAGLVDLLLAGPSTPADRELATAHAVLWQLRGPRIVGCVLVGAALAASGSALQSVFRNPLAAPDLLGVSAGAGLGAAFGILSGWPAVAIQGCAFVGGLLAVVLVWGIGNRLAFRDRILGLVLAGIAIGSLFGALIALVKLLADPLTQLPAITFWLLGSFASIGVSELGWLAGATVLGVLPMLALRWQADALALSDDEVRALGIRLGRLRAALVLGATVATAASVAAAGIIGWVGLIIPHAARLLVGPRFGGLLPVSMLLGALLMVLVDSVARSGSGIELPPGVLTALIGVPALFLLMAARRDD